MSTSVQCIGGQSCLAEVASWTSQASRIRSASWEYLGTRQESWICVEPVGMDQHRCIQCSAHRHPGTEPCPLCGSVGTVVYASWWQRVSAWLLDGLLVWLIAYGTWFAVVWNRHEKGRTWEAAWGLNGEADLFFGMLLLTLVGGGLLGLLWHVAWLGSPSNATPGQRIAGFRVLRQTTLAPMHAGRALLREFVKIGTFILGNGVKLIADAVLVGVMDRRQSLHDLAVGTVCVKPSTIDVPPGV